MKFELKPHNYGLRDNELLDDLRAVAQRLCKDSITKEEYNQHGRLCAATFQKRFGSWGKSLDLAGLKRSRYDKVESEDYLTDIRRVANELQEQSLTQDDYQKHGKFSYASIIRHLGAWKDVLAQAGLKPSEGFNAPFSDEELFENLEQLWEKLGQQPNRKHFIKPLSKCSYDCYPRRFGTYRKALEAFVASFENKLKDTQPQEEPESVPQLETFTPTPIHKTSRNISWRTRFLVMRRDDFKCQLCGVSPAMQPRTVLVVDHVKPWAAGGETVIENLQTLCEPCNGGKSNLPLKEKKKG